MNSLFLNDTTPKIILTERLILIAFTKEICHEILENNFDSLNRLGIKKGLNWPDADMIENLPRIIKNLSKVISNTGFESWMIVKKETNEIIGDVGFKGLNTITNTCDIGYGIIQSERRNGFAEEACRALINWATTQDHEINITASTSLTNVGSIKLLEKISFIEYERDEEFIYWKLNVL